MSAGATKEGVGRSTIPVMHGHEERHILTLKFLTRGAVHCCCVVDDKVLLKDRVEFIFDGFGRALRRQNPFRFASAQWLCLLGLGVMRQVFGG